MKPANRSTNIEFSEFDEQILKEQAIAENYPGTILKDFNCLLDYIQSHNIEASKLKAHFSLKHLNSINGQFSHPLTINLPRPQQKSFPNISGLYLILRASGIVDLYPVRNKMFFQLNEQIYNSWNDLNNTERYFTLLESWLLKSNPKALLDEHRPFYGSLLIACFQFWAEIPSTGLKVEDDRHINERLKYFPCLYNIALLELFGLLEIIHGEPKPGKSWSISMIKRSTFGDAIFRYLNIKVLTPEDHLISLFNYEIDKANRPYGEWQEHFLPFFPDWHDNLIIPEPEFVKGTYIFKVLLGEIWRRIEIHSDMTLEDLADTILDSFEFDKDHLYMYSYKDRFGNTVEINSPNSYDEPFTTEICIGEIPIKIGSSMTFLFDFGDQWEFQVLLEEINRTDKKLQHPVVMEKHGESPDQYPDWDDEEYDFE